MSGPVSTLATGHIAVIMSDNNNFHEHSGSEEITNDGEDGDITMFRSYSAASTQTVYHDYIAFIAVALMVMLA